MVIASRMALLSIFLTLFEMGAAEATSPLPRLVGTKRVVVVVSLHDRSGHFSGLKEEEVANFIRDSIASRLAAPKSQAREYEKPRPDLPVVVVPWSEFSHRFNSNWDLVLLWRFSVDDLGDAVAKREQAAVSYLLVYDFLDCDDGVLRPKTNEQVLASSWVTGWDRGRFFEDLAKDLAIRLRAVIRDLREDAYSSDGPQPSADSREEVAKELFSETEHLEVTTLQGGLSIFTLLGQRSRENWTISTVLALFNPESGADSKKPLSVSAERGTPPERSRQLDAMVLLQDYPEAVAEREFTFLTIAVTIRWPRYPFSAVLAADPISIKMPVDSEAEETAYRLALKSVLEDVRSRFIAGNR